MCLLNFVLFFQINYKCDFGDSVYVVGNIDAIGSWNSQKAIKLTWSEGHNWSTKLRIIHDNRETVQYKYIIAPSNMNGPINNINWERGPNCLINLYSSSKLYLNLKDEWEHYQVRIAVQSDSWKKKWSPSQHMFMTTSFGSKVYPIEMELKQLTISGGTTENSFWTASFFIPHSITSFNYKLKIVDLVTQETQSGGSPRKFEMKKFPSSININEIYAVEGTSLTKFDFRGNLSFNFDNITDEIFVGSSPSSPGHIEELLASGIKSVLNLQTFGDMNRYAINWEDIKEQYQKANIAVEHYPILDMDNEDLSQKIKEAADLIEKLIKENGKLYVHCSAGKYRSPHSVIFYLWQHKKYDLESAIELIKNKRKKVKINIFEEVFGQTGEKAQTPKIKGIKLEKAISAVY